MVSNFIKYALVLSHPELQILVFLALLISDSKPPRDRLTSALFIIQAGCIDVVGVASVLSGVAVPLVVSVMIAQGIYLTVDAHRTITKQP